jgi:DNA adenine methylase
MGRLMVTEQTGVKAKRSWGAGCTPFRYPGGKAFFADALAARIALIPNIDSYAEPYAGGAGAAIDLLSRGVVERIILNDYDRRIYAAWWAILNRTEDFVALIRSVALDLPTWHHYRDLVEENNPDADLFELGFGTFFLNRTNHSGVIIGAGPIGGYKQTGKWLMDARFYRETLIKRIEWLGSRKGDIQIFNLDGLEFLKTFKRRRARKTFFFIDPPYVKAGKKLYLDAMSHTKHHDLASFLTEGAVLPHWLVTYDNCALINDAYATANVERIPVRYSLHNKRNETEICVVPLGC